MSSTLEEYKKSYTVSVAKALIKLFSQFSFYHRIAVHFWGKHRKVPLWVGEVYVWIFALLMTMGLFLMPYIGAFAKAVLFLAFYRLFDIMMHVGRMIFIESSTVQDEKGHYIIIEARNVERWVILNIANICEIILCYSALYLFWGQDFEKDIINPITAIYQSFLTLTTLGYGEIHADGYISKLLVISQLAYFIVFILLVAPLVFSSIRAKGVSK